MAIYEVLTITFSANTDTLSLVEKTIQKQGGKVQDKKEWGEKNLTFPIRKQTSGFYTLWEVELEPTKVSSLKRELKIQEEILRAMIVKRS